MFFLRAQIIGWRDISVLRLLLFITDAGYHVAGDGAVSEKGREEGRERGREGGREGRREGGRERASERVSE